MSAADQDVIAGVIVAAVKHATAPLVQRLDALDALLAARPTVTDAGVWKAGDTYQPGNLVSHGGSGWICRAAHVAAGSEPDHQCFRLFVKRGRDGKDSR